MKDTVLHPKDACAGQAAMPHATKIDGGTSRIPLDLETAVYSVAPAGGAWSTALDMAKYVQMELAKGKLPDGKQFISEEALLERRNKGIKIDQNSSYGLGLFIGEDTGLRFIGHGGNTLGFSTDMFLLPEKDLGAVILTNIYAGNMFLLAVRQKIFEILFGAEAKSEKTVAAAMKLRDEEGGWRTQVYL